MHNTTLSPTLGHVIAGHISEENAPKSLVKVIEFRPIGAAAGAAMILESSVELSVIGNKFYDF